MFFCCFHCCRHLNNMWIDSSWGPYIHVKSYDTKTTDMLNPSKIESLCKWTFKLFSWPITHSIPFFWSQIAGRSFQIFNFSPNATHVPSTWLSLECLGPMNLKGGNSKTCSPKPFDIQWYRCPSVCLHDRIIISQLFLPSLECWWYLSAALLDSNRCSLQIKVFLYVLYVIFVVWVFDVLLMYISS